MSQQPTPDSNQLMARQAWLDKVDIPEDNIHQMKTDGASPQADAERHAAEFKAVFLHRIRVSDFRPNSFGHGK